MNKKRLEEAGIDVELTLRRMGGRKDLAEKYWRHFLKDPSFEEMKAAKNQEELLRAVHTLKGVSANLGMNGLSGSCADMVMMLRQGVNNTEEIEKTICVQYETIMKAIALADEEVEEV